MSRRTPRVLLVGLGLELSGSGRFLTGLARGLAAHGVDTRLWVVRGGPLARDLDGTDVALTVAAPELGLDAGRLALGVGSFAKLARHIRAVEPDVVHTNLIGLDLLGRLACLGSGVPVLVSTQHDVNPRPWFVNAFRRATVGRISATVACSESVAEYCRDVMHVPASKLVTIENGIDTARLESAAAPIHAVTRFVALGALAAPKDHATLIDAMALVHAEQPDAMLTVYGDGPLRGELEARVRERGLVGVVALERPVPDVVSALRACDVFVQPSVREGLSLSLLEAMAAAKPIVASDIPSHASVLECGRCGVLVPVGDAEALARAMLAVTADRAAAEGMGALAQARAQERYSLERMAEEYAALYAELLLRVSG